MDDDVCPNAVEALEDIVFGGAQEHDSRGLHAVPPAMGEWVAHRILIESRLRQDAADPASIHAGLQLSNATVSLPNAVIHPLRTGVLKLNLNLRQRMAALKSLRDERDYVFLRDRAQYVRAALL